MDRRSLILAGLLGSGCVNAGRNLPLEVGEELIAAPQDFCMQKNALGEWYWTLRASNYNVIATSEGYKQRADCERAIEIVRRATASTPINYECPR